MPKDIRTKTHFPLAPFQSYEDHYSQDFNISLNVQLSMPNDPYGASSASSAPPPRSILSVTESQFHKDGDKVDIACVNCRARKIRCDGLKPQCNNCQRRNRECQFDTTIKRRGRDKVPGGRKALRAAKKLATDPSGTTAAQHSSTTTSPRASTANDNDPQRLRTRINLPSLPSLAPICPPPASQPLKQEEMHWAQHHDMHRPSNIQHLPSPSSSCSPDSGYAPLRRDSSEAENGRSHSYSPSSPFQSTPSEFPPRPNPFPRRPNSMSTSPLLHRPTPYRKPSSRNPVFHDHSCVPFPAQHITPPYSTPTTPLDSQLVPNNFFLPINATPHAYLTPVEDEESDLEAELGSGNLNESVRISSNFRGKQCGAPSNLYYGPSVDFTKKTWWDALLGYYGSNREASANQVSSDLSFLFSVSHYWFSFIHVPLFFATFYNPSERSKMQPSLVLALLAVSNLTKGSELENGHVGRTLALRLRDAAQSALEASLNSMWIDPTLAQAAWVLAYFEICAHPLRSAARSISANVLFDSLIRSLSLTCIDAPNPQASIFPADSPAVLPLSHSAIDPSNGSQGCVCASVYLPTTNREAAEKTPLWLTTPGWDPSWGITEIKVEENRRLVWCALQALTGFAADGVEWGFGFTPYFITDPFNYSLLFPGESQLLSTFELHPERSYVAKESVWALYNRIVLLWSSSLRMRHGMFSGPSDTLLTTSELEAKNAEFAIQTWLQCDAIEEALNKHSCSTEQSIMYVGREWIFNIRMLISHDFSRFVPCPETSQTKSLFNRDSIVRWVEKHQHVAKALVNGLAAVTRVKDHSLARRPFFVFWFETTANRCLSLWRSDPSFTSALELSKALLPPIEYLTCLFPCTSQRVRFMAFRKQVEEACVEAGIDLPPPPNFTLPNKPL